MKVLSGKLPKAILGPAVLGVILSSLVPSLLQAQCLRTITADVVALDQAFYWNRLGAMQPQGMIFALRRDVVPSGPGGLAPGNVRLREDKRPRPLVLRANVGDCLQVKFQNLLAAVPADAEQPATRKASVHVMGMQLVGSIASDGSNVGANASSLVAPGGSATYTFYAEREGPNLLYSTAATTGGEGDGGSLNSGLFGAVNIEPRGSEWYRSQVTKDDLDKATVAKAADNQHPIVNYNAVYPAGHRFAGYPILKMLNASNQIVHSDLTAIITGPNAGRFPAGTYRPNPTEPDRDQPFREFTFIYHDEIGAVQAFPRFFGDTVADSFGNVFFGDQALGFTLHSVRDGFAINYGSAGAGAEVLANRLGRGPVWKCPECKYEEFFLSSWAMGDPAMVVDVPANDGLETLGPDNPVPAPTRKATKALYPDDPSNVYHSYIRDHVKFRLIHGGSKEHHIHHLHAHQWLHTPDSDNSTYHDSQVIGPGSAYTLEITHNGSGNRNQTVGDSIFHCHFYPHFAQGMWSLWRTHDVFESGTELDENGYPVHEGNDFMNGPITTHTRALPDGEILTGTPIPALVPLPTLPMAPIPAEVMIVNGQAALADPSAPVENPGYPFFAAIDAGLSGHMPPQPPLDFVDGGTVNEQNGGLPRHYVADGTVAIEEHTRLSFIKELATLDAVRLPEEGTPVERAAMQFHELACHPSYKPDGSPAACPNGFITNGRAPAPGAPYADPCPPGAYLRRYKAAILQLDIPMNKVGWHFPQSRILTLWEDVQATLNKEKPPEPLFFRANTGDCIEFWHANLASHVYQQDDFQVETPTDIMGQHIHLVKFDVTSSDGSANGWNYADGTFTPLEVGQRINAINANGGLWSFDLSAQEPLALKLHPLGVKGAQTTIQRWYADDVLNNLGQDRTLRTVFTHDHFGPSTHQQAGLYAGLVTEPQGSTWRDPETGIPMYTRDDGGPTSWRADILLNGGADAYREFLFEFQDYQLAYKDGSGGDAAKPVPDPEGSINPPARHEVPLSALSTALLVRPDGVNNLCPGNVPAPCPEAVSADDVGTMTVNYRNEPIPLRVRNPLTNTQATGDAGDLSMVFRSNVVRADPLMNVQPDFFNGAKLTGGVQPGDPFTPLLRVYENDKVQIRAMVGATEEGHNLSVHGIKWLREPSDSNSGYLNSQIMGISEHFSFLSPVAPRKNPNLPYADHLYQVGSSVDDLWNGLWGILRAYRSRQTGLDNLEPLPNNVPPANPQANQIANPLDFNGPCPKTAPMRYIFVSAVTARQALPGGTLVYNPRTNLAGQHSGKLHDPTAILYVRTSDLDPTTGKLKAGVPVEPLILRANAGDCIQITLNNRLPQQLTDLPGYSTMPMIVDDFNANQVKPSSRVGLHPQLLGYDVTSSDGATVGLNPIQTAQPGGIVQYKWYAGDLGRDASNRLVATPIEFGATNLISSDPIKHSNKGAIGALIIEPRGSTYIEDMTSRASATIQKPDGTYFREFIVMFQNDVNLRFGDDSDPFTSAVPNTADAEDPEDSGQKAVNYRTEPMWKRLNYAPDTRLTGGHGGAGSTRELDFSNALSNTQVGGDPVTPVFTARLGAPIRFRVLHAGGHQRNHVFELHGHVWQEEPYTSNSTVIGNNPLSEWKGSQAGHGPTNHINVVPMFGAGGKHRIGGDYLWRDFQSFQFDGGIWGLLRVR